MGGKDRPRQATAGLALLSAFRRAEQMFVALGGHRHVHACRRQLAGRFWMWETSTGRACLAGAKGSSVPAPVADTTVGARRRPVQCQAGRFDEAIQTWSGPSRWRRRVIDRYEVVLLEDIARCISSA